ncbi:hypothetical protein DP144_12895 [Clostridium tetani]|uniref:hypothetical protein n=1 Tax=Clostridium tetani TaxID=1513 RepID=UPI00100C0573|nr:hypothetical protein [Clostridium tetani]RXM74053.1 hypothetical protein DP154_13135 [Clostridium tetani]RYU97955.1 hypothetical protein DP144_12895 [Clostridium tetani]
MKDLEFIILVMTTIEAGGYFASNKEVENYIKLYDDEYPNKKNIKEDIIDILSLIKKLKFSPDSLWLRKTTLFTLIVELVFYKHRKKSLLEVSSLRNLLIELEEKIVANKSEYMAENKFAKFYKYIYQGTASRTSRIARGELLQEFLDKTE